jgi:septum formation protein
MTSLASGPFVNTISLVLASASPRRKELLASAGLSFEILPGTAPEPRPLPGEPPEKYTIRAARDKAEEAVQALRQRKEFQKAIVLAPDTVVLAADTAVVLGDDILGKPEDREDAERMLAGLCGEVRRTHRVVTGCCLLILEEGKTVEVNELAVSTEVTMAGQTTETIAAYAATGEPLDKAGGYAIQGQGSFLVEAIRGSYTNVVGLPLAEVLEALKKWGAVAPAQ